jgi:hypothetical protein
MSDVSIGTIGRQMGSRKPRRLSVISRVGHIGFKSFKKVYHLELVEEAHAQKRANKRSKKRYIWDAVISLEQSIYRTSPAGPSKTTVYSRNRFSPSSPKRLFYSWSDAPEANCYAQHCHKFDQMPQENKALLQRKRQMEQAHDEREIDLQTRLGHLFHLFPRDLVCIIHLFLFDIPLFLFDIPQ